MLVETANAEAVSIRAIGQAVGVTAPSIYRHFPDKDALIFAVCDRCFDTMHEYEEREVATASNPLEVMHAMGRAYIQFALDNPGQYRVMMMSPDVLSKSSVPLEAEHIFGEARGLKSVIDAVVAAQREHLIRNVDPFELALLLWSSVHGIVSIRIAKPHMPWPPIEQQLNFFFETMAFGMCPPNSPTPS